jgi:xanthine dehydrogenase YagR molybdenum-binding subunit
VAQGVVVSSTIARGRIVSFDVQAALAIPGVLEVLTHENRPRMASLGVFYRDLDAVGGTPFKPLHDDRIFYSGQPVALVVAETFEAARCAAALVRVVCEAEPHATDLAANRGAAHHPSRWKFGYEPPAKATGDVDAAFARAPFRVAAEYAEGAEYHNPMELFASTVVWEGNDRLTIHDKTQGSQNSHFYLCNALKLKRRNVRVLNPYVGGAFGSGLRPQYQLVLATLAALKLRRSVRVVMTRQQMFSFGHRPESMQTLKLACRADGRLVSIDHAVVAETSRYEDYVESVTSWSALLYHCANIRLTYALVALDRSTPLDMRAPGAASGVRALECAMDELAYEVAIDPLEMRRVNYTERDEGAGRPFSSKGLRECLALGAERFGWSRRDMAPGSMRDGRLLVGWGLATGVWDAAQMPASARAVLTSDGRLRVSSATSDIGTGTYTVMAQIAAATLGLPLERIAVELGDSDMPLAPLEGGSFTAASIGTAVQAVCAKIGKRLYTLARRLEGSPLGKARLDDIEFRDGALCLRTGASIRVPFVDAMRASGIDEIDEKSTTVPHVLRQRKATRATHSAVFAEVKIDPDIGMVHVTRVVSAVAAGRIINPRTAENQVRGGVVWGIGQALHETAQWDHRFGRLMNHSLAEYHLSANADVGEIDVVFVPEEDRLVNPLGIKGVGEIGIIGVAAAVANAVFHATGRRVRDLPITPDKVLGLTGTG